uniref:Uncharacterized protein n=1 Tax=Strigamia maritima TaxID=126957 RepID=T1J9Q8_STRMM
MIYMTYIIFILLLLPYINVCCLHVILNPSSAILKVIRYQLVSIAYFSMKDYFVFALLLRYSTQVQAASSVSNLIADIISDVFSKVLFPALNEVVVNIDNTLEAMLTSISDEDCEICTTFIKSGIPTLQTLIKKIEPVDTWFSPQLCSICSVTGMANFDLSKDTAICPDGDLTTIFFTTKNIIFDCDCELKCDPAELPDIIDTEFQGLDVNSCPDEGESSAAIYKRQNLTNMRSQQQCQSRVNDSAEILAQNQYCVGGKATGKIRVKWPEFEIRFVLSETTTDNVKQPITLGGGKIMSTNYKDVKMECSNDNPIFSSSCGCLKATGFGINLIKEVFENDWMLPCE